MRKVLAVFMAVMMILSTFAGIMTVSAADETTTLAELALGNITMSDATTGKGSTTATDYINGSFDFAGVMNSTWASASAEVKATYAQPSQTYSVVNTSDLTAYPDIASGHSAKLLKHTQTANAFMFRLKNLVNTAKLPTTGKIRISMDVYPTDVTAGTIESTTKTGVKAEKGTLASDYQVRIGESKGTGDTGTMTATVVKADQWNTITRTFDLSSNNTMSAIRYDVATSSAKISSYNTPFPATFFYDKVKIEYIGTEITGGGSAGGDNTGDDNTGDDNTGDDVVGGETVTVWENVLNVSFENNSYAPAGTMNIWAKDSANKNVNTVNSIVSWATAGISKPNSTEDFGSSLVKCDTTTKSNAVTGVYEGRLNDFANFTFEKGAKYRYSIWAYLAKTTNDGATDTADMTIKPYGGAQTAKLGSTTATLTKGEWKKIEYEIEISGDNEWAAGQTSGFRFAFSPTTGNCPTIIYMDNARVEKLTEKVVGGGDSGSTERVKVNIGFEDGTPAPSTGWNFWGKKPSDGNNTDALQKVINWADETTISKPNSTENFGSKLIKVDGNSTVSTKGVYTGRINDIPAANIGFTAGKKYTFSAWILVAKTAASDTVQVEMYPYCNNQGTAGIPANTFDIKHTLKVGEWQKVEGSFVATEAHVGKNAGFRFRLSEVNGTNYITLLYMDNVNIVESDDTAASYDLKVTAEGNGTVTGAGKYSEGTVATLKATPDSGYEFTGWYDGTTLLSKENPYEYTVDGKVTSITAKFEKVQANKGDNWYTIDTVDFEDATASGISCTGKTANGLPYTFSALDGGVTTVKVSSAALTEAEAGIGTSSNKVYKFAKTEGPDANSGMMRFSNFFSLDKLSVGDIIRVSFKVYPTDLCVMEGKSDKTAGFQAFYSISGKYGSSSAKNASDSTGSRYLKLNEWNNIGFTTTVNQEMLDASKTGALRLSAINEQSYAKTMYFDDVKVEVYQNKSAADELYIVENFDNERPVSNISATAGFETAPYIAKIFTRSDNNTKYARFNVFGTGTAGSNVSLVTNKADLSGVLAHSGTNAIKFSGRWSANGGVKVEDIFMGRFDKEDIGRKVKVSAWVYADKSAGAYKMTADGEGFKENGSKNDAPKYTDDELANLEKTKICISFGGPNDGFYSYRTGGYNTKKYTINWNEWTKISTEFIVYEDLLDNGTTNKNPLISSIRIDQQGCTGIEDEAVIDTFYIDDITVEEPKFEVSSAIGTHMVYQKGRPIRVWGTNADIGEEVTVKFNGVTKTATTAEDKKWVAEFDKIDSYTRNLEIEVACPGEETLKFTDVSVGEVILASGQSNMEWNLKKVYEAEDIIADAETNDNISILSFEPSQSNRGSYEVLTSPKGAYWAKKDVPTAEICSGVGYITAYNIAKKYNIPVAVVDANLSGSSIKAWLSAETIEARKDDVYKDIYKEMVDKSTKVDSGSIWKQVPAGMYNSLLAPLDNYEIGIMLWYQGCSDSGKADLYNYQQYDLINSWRELFGAEDTPFYICQLAPYSSSYMNLRQVQLDTAKRMDNVHLVVTADLGPTGSEDKESKLYSEMTSGNEIHPVRKIPVADRIALNLYANYFGEDILYSGPEYTKMEAKDNYAILHFKHIGSGLVKADPDKELTGFEVSADGETFVKATAEILADNTIKVYAEGVDKVVKARYCWVNWVVPEDALTSEGGKKLGNTLGGNLTNETGIPAGPFMATLPAPTIFAAETATLATGLSVDISVRNIGYSESSPRLIVGLYDGERLVGLKSETIDFMTIDTKTVEFDFYTLTTLINENTTIKAFLWNDMGSMIPLTGVYPIERK